MEGEMGSPVPASGPSFGEAVADFPSSAEALADAASAPAVESPQKISAAREHHCAVEDDDDDTSEDFEFAFVIKDLESGPAITADEIFSNGQIRPVYPVFNRDLLLANSGGTVEGQAARPPLKKLLIDERNASSSASSSMDELNGIPSDSYCMWFPGSAVPSPARTSKKSRSTGSSFRWRIRDLVRRSQSDGNEKFVFLASQERNAARSSEKKKEEEEVAEDEEGEEEVKGEERRAVKKGDELTDMGTVTDHRIYNGSKGGGSQSAKGVRRSFFPLKSDIVGFFAHANSVRRTHHPY